MFINTLKTCVGISSVIASFSIFAAPVVTSVDNSGYSSGTVTINGSGFGTGPNIILFDTFESESVSVGDAIPISSPIKGAWTKDNTTPPFYNLNSHSGKFSAEVFTPNGKNGRMRQFQLFFPGTTEAYISYWVRLPDGAIFPSNDATLAPKQFPADSSWKLNWLIDQDTGTTSPNINLPTHVGGGRFYLAGNDMNLDTKLGNSWWSWTSWMRISVWLKANKAEPAVSGNYEFQVNSTEHGYFKKSDNLPVFDSDGPAIKQYQQLNFPGWMRTESQSSPLYDDIYVATGDNSVSRVEIVDAPIYENAKHIALQIPTSWNDTQVTFSVNKGDFADARTAWVFVWDGNGVKNPTPLQIFSPPSTILDLNAQ